MIYPTWQHYVTHTLLYHARIFILRHATDKFSFVFVSLSLASLLAFPFRFGFVFRLRRFYYLDFDLFQLLIISDTKEYPNGAERGRQGAGQWGRA